ncbi:ABC-2 family transporter protein [Kribbella sp. NBC_01505]|uniref:ABC transporter permease n=1 Tax=Kribbella sp. NBC_01505 TaxID=2903580 RepID=UPI00386723B9
MPWSMIRLGTKNALYFRANVVLSMLSVALQTVLLVTVWRAVYAGRGAVAGISEADAVSYAVIAMLVWHVALPWQLSSIPDRVREGTIATDLIRPVGVVGQSLLQSVGGTVGAIPGVVVGLAIALAMGGLTPPAGGVAFLGFVLTAALGWLIAALLNLAVSMVAFWTTDTRGSFYVYRAIASFASGALVPLWFIPSWLRPILDALPFGLQVFAPLQLWQGEAPLGGLWGVLAAQLGWLAAAAAIVALVTWRALRKVVINGG